MVAPRYRRQQSQTERDVSGFAALQERNAAPEYVEADDEISGHYDVEERAQIRARRPTQERLARLEVKHDDLAGDVREMKGTLGALFKLTAEERDARVSREKQEAEERAHKRAGWPTLIKAIAAGIAVICTAVLGALVASGR